MRKLNHYLDCPSPDLRLISSKPTKYQRSHDILIQSFVQLFCLSFTHINTIWSITNATSLLFNIYNQTEIYLPSFTLHPGQYQITLHLHVYQSTFNIFSINTSISIEILPSPIRIYFFPSNPTFFTHFTSDDLVLNPGQFSLDPDITPFPTEVHLSSTSSSSSSSLSFHFISELDLWLFISPSNTSWFIFFQLSIADNFVIIKYKYVFLFSSRILCSNVF